MTRRLVLTLIGLVVILPLYAVGVSGQACGPTYLTIYLKDSAGTLVTTADVQLFDSSFTERTWLHLSPHDSDDPSHPRIVWSEKRGAFFGSETMCGGHRDVGLRILAKGFEPFDKVIDIPLGWTSYAISLRRPGSTDVPVATKLAHVKGWLTDANKEDISSATVAVVGNNRVLQTVASEYGIFHIDLDPGRYSLRISSPGFRRLVLTNFEIENSDGVFLDLALTGKKDSLVGGDSKRSDEVIDYRTIKGKIND